MNVFFDSTKPIAIGSDHAGFEYKSKLIEWLTSKGLKVKDFGVDGLQSVDYPDYAHPVAKAVESGESTVGVLLCGSANGVCITANKHQGIRAGLAFDIEVARLIRQHNDANIICIPARFVAYPYAEQMLETYLTTAFEGGRHQNRVNKISCS
ncbi:ribose 5-phosphate isomerase B [Gynurincola endophyticus]|uniref:ribose 5-phosphate isomerase B n=1 Tax=Gynurincola endophyticus TaxID=2479004 RepID=UPI000F8C9020|nr:ribose 5-phosphate isomerase B [Gynurincola endophyticus]